MILSRHYEDGSIEVTEALATELIDSALFEMDTQGSLRVWDFSDDGHGHVTGFVKITARNGTWTYKLTRKCWWLDEIYEMVLIEGQVIPYLAMTTAS